MADRFWVAGTGAFSDNTNHWSATSGGAPGASKPGASDNATWDANSGGGTCTFDEAVGVISITCGAYASGTINTNGQAVTCSGAFDISGTATRTVTLGASAISCATWTATTTTNLTFNANTSIITMTGTGTFGGGSLTYSGVVLTSTSTATVSGSNTFTNLTRTNASGYAYIAFGGNQTISGTFTVTGNNASTQRIFVSSDTPGVVRAIVAAAVSLTNADFESITASGASAPWGGTSLGNCGGLFSINTTSPITTYWVHDGTASHPITDARWFTASGGAVAARFPLPQDTAIFDANSFGATGKTVTIGTAGLRLPSVNFTGATNGPTLSLDVAVVLYGPLTLIGGMTVSGSGNLTFAARASVTLTSAGKTIGSALLILSAPGGTLTIQDALTLSGGIRVDYGTLTANNFSVTAATVASSNTNTRTVTMGSGTWTLTGTGTVWDFATVTNLTLTPGTSTIKINDASATAKTFSGGGKTYNNLWLTGAGTGTFDVVGSNTFADLKADTPPHTIRFTAGTTTTVTTFTVNGSSTQQMTITSITAAQHSLVKTGAGIVVVRNCTISYSAASPANTWYAR